MTDVWKPEHHPLTDHEINNLAADWLYQSLHPRRFAVLVTELVALTRGALERERAEWGMLDRAGEWVREEA